LSFLIKGLLKIPGLNEVTLTTNGVLLNRYVDELWEAGLRRLNVSLDTLDFKTYRQLTGRDDFSKVWEGLQTALRKGFSPVKINVVLLKGINEDIEPFINLTRDFPLHIRFIELMEFAPQHDKFYVSAEEVRQKFIKLGGYREETPPLGAGPAKYFRLEGAAGTVGFISPYTEHFCETCNRLRVSADGKIRPCLFSDFAVDVKKPLRSSWPEEKLRDLIIKALKAKPEGRKKAQKRVAGRGMRRIGG
jgi:cyclic pyranopterin phosphate synthase